MHRLHRPHCLSHTHTLTLVEEKLSLCSHRLVVADGVQLSAEHNSCEGEEEERLHAEEDHQHHGDRRREVTAL